MVLGQADDTAVCRKCVGAVFFQKRYEETLPLSLFAIVAVLFLSGLVDGLRLRYWILCVLSAAAYVASVYWVVCKKNVAEVLRRIFTSAFFY